MFYSPKEGGANQLGCNWWVVAADVLSAHDNPKLRIYSWRVLITAWRQLSVHPEWTDLFSDVTVLVDVVQVEGPVEFFLNCAPQQNGEAHNKILQRKQVLSIKNPTTEESWLTCVNVFCVAADFMRQHLLEKYHIQLLTRGKSRVLKKKNIYIYKYKYSSNLKYWPDSGCWEFLGFWAERTSVWASKASWSGTMTTPLSQ